ncbi:hypothetical protein PG985_007105 [Apiospora marii]|uniref:HhH-GPD domain-containing protein n=1 Tax=Apiospora marii TaxID=335849 RepID=A0ABR1SF05_9PEZI
MQTRAAARRAVEVAQVQLQVHESESKLDGPEEGAADHKATILAASSSSTAQTEVAVTTARSGVVSNPPSDPIPNAIGAATVVPNSTTRKRSRKTSNVPVRGGWDVLPHNLGQLWTPNNPAGGEANGTQMSNLYEDTTDVPLKKRLRSSTASSSNEVVLAVPAIPSFVSRKEQPQNRAQEQDVKENAEQQSPPKVEQKTPKRKARKTKDNPYGLTPGETPYPDWQGPNPEQCEEVYRILAEMHDDVQPLPPQKIPAPSLEVAGCGEVPCVLDGLIRTVLSGSTTFDTADKMLQALVEKFGVSEEGTGAGSVNWNNIRIADYDDVYQQLKSGGLGANKAKNIQAILGMVYEENMQRRAAYIEEQETGKTAEVVCASSKTKGQKDLEILRADQNKLNLDFMHDMTKDEALQHFVRYPGVGVKTAACVTLFSLQRPCFAVDTHVFRMSRWLGWVPQKTNEDDTFRHLEVRCPDHLKYGLHQLFIRHGKTCYRCNDKSFKGTEAWDESVCPLEQLLDRFSKRQAKPKELTKPKSKGKKKRDPNGDIASEVDEGETSHKPGSGKIKDDTMTNTDVAPGGSSHTDNDDGNQTEGESELSELDSSDLEPESLQT